MTQQERIAIIGAGFTGLTTAYRLAQKGYSVTIFEKTDTLGGLVSGFEIEGQNLERAYHFLYKTDHDIIGLVEELNIRTKLHFYDSSLATYYTGKLYPMMTPLDLIKFTPLSFLNRIRAGVVVLYLQHVKNWHKFTSITAYDWLSKWAGSQVTEIIWEPLLRGKFHNFYNKIAMSWLWSRIRVRANSKEKGDATEKLGYFDGGFQIFTDAINAKLKQHKVIIRTGVNIESIDSNRADKKAGIRINGKTHKFDRIVATIPSHVFANLIGKNISLPNSYLKKLQRVDYLGAITLVFASNQDLSNYYWHNINDTNKSFLVFLSLTKLVGTERYNGKHIYYIGAYVPHEHRYFNIPDKKITQEWFQDLKEILPVFDIQQVTENHIFRYKNAQHIVALDYSTRIPEYQTPLNGIYLANFSQIYPDDRGTNYAVREGNKVANLVDLDLQNS